MKTIGADLCVNLRAGAVALAMIGVQVLSAGASASGLNVLPGSIREFAMTTCRADHKVCYTIRSESAEGSSLKRLFVLENVRLTIAGEKTGKAQTETWPKGYVDLDMNRLVVWRTAGAIRTEKYFDF